MTIGSKTANEIATALRARASLLWIVTREESRVERYLIDACASAGYVPSFWDCATGHVSATGEAIDGYMTDPGAILSRIRGTAERRVVVLRDFHAWIKDPTILRGLRSLARDLAIAPRDTARAVIVLAPVNEVPPELSAAATVIEFPLPDREEIAALLDAAIDAVPSEIGAAIRAQLVNGKREAAIDAAVGLSSDEAAGCYRKSLVSTKTIDAGIVGREKKSVISREKVLEWIDPLPGGLDSVGGLENLKTWLVSRRAAFSAKARAYGLPAPKGALLVGVPGCGKSLTAKAIATAWGMPLLRLDLGALKSKWVGESEGNIRRALRTAEAVSPCVVWLDEIEKALGGATQGAADGGVSSDALGVILSWMQDRAGAAFVIATANDVSALPPELLRKGRFDDLFFVDLPTTAERKGIATAALKSHGRGADGIDLAAIAAATVDFTGAEIAALVPEALFAAFADGERAISTADLVNAAHATVPLAKTAAEKITKVREWAKGRARPASAPETAAARTGGVDL